MKIKTLVKKNSKVIFYGCGKNCKIWYDRLILSGYYNLIAVIDKYPKDKEIMGISVLGIDKLLDLEYDAIFITVGSNKIISEIVAELKVMNIPSTKIIHQYLFYQNFYSENIVEPQYLSSYINYEYNFYKYSKNKLCSFSSMVKDFVDNKRLLDSLRQVKNSYAKIFYLQKLYTLGVFDCDYMQEYMKCLLEMAWEDDSAYGLIMDTMRMTFLNNGLLYPNYFLDRIELQKRLCSHYNIYEIKKNNKIQGKVAIIVDKFNLNQVIDAVASIARGVAVGLSKNGYKVSIFVLGTMVRNDASEIEQTYFMSEENVISYEIDAFEGCDIEVVYKNHTTIRKRLNENIKNIINYNPEFIIDMSDESFVEGYVFEKDIPIIVFPMRQLSFSAAYTIWLTTNKKNIEEYNLVYKALDMNSVMEVKMGAMYDLKDSVCYYKRDEYGFSSEDFIIVTVGSRLNNDIDAIMAESMKKMLLNNSCFKWILVGDIPSCVQDICVELIQEKRIVFWGIERNLQALYGMCDIFFNPIRTGGGVSIRMAMYEGLPIIVSNKIKDPLAYVLLDEVVDGGYEEMTKRCVLLYKNKNLYFKLSETGKEKMKKLTPKEDVRHLLKYINQEIR